MFHCVWLWWLQCSMLCNCPNLLCLTVMTVMFHSVCLWWLMFHCVWLWWLQCSMLCNCPSLLCLTVMIHCLTVIISRFTVWLTFHFIRLWHSTHDIPQIRSTLMWLSVIYLYIHFARLWYSAWFDCNIPLMKAFHCFGCDFPHCDVNCDLRVCDVPFFA